MTQARNAIRGAALAPFVRWYGAVHGRAGLDRALSRLDAGDRRLFDPALPGLGISITDWYPAALVHPMLDGLLEGFDARAREELASSGADQTLAVSLDGLLGIAFRALVSPRVCAIVGPRLWQGFYSSGTVRIEAEGRGRHVMSVRGWSGHHDFLCSVNCAAGRSIYRAAGAGAATTEHAACIGRGDAACVYVIRWQVR